MSLEEKVAELQKEIKSLRLILKSHGEIVEENYKLRQFIKSLQVVPTSYYPEDVRILLVNYNEYEKLKSKTQNL